MLKNRNLQIVLGVVLILALFGGTYYVLFGKTKQKEAPVETSGDVVQSLKAEDLGLDLEVSPDQKKVKFSISKASDIASIEYQITYEADSTAQEQSEGSDDRVQKGIVGQANVVSGNASYESDWLVLGTCSKNVCRYDTKVNNIDLTLKITKKDGKVFQSEKKLEL